ncbi:MAG: zinc-ribbon domain-containing protein [Eggerthellaceae bacterium]|nr:zinc-ribbon domain-containing protein [Eggerthellaceae bacterium]
MFCEKCGAQIKDGSRFCPNCGHMVTRAASERPQPSQQKPQQQQGNLSQQYPNRQKQGGAGAPQNGKPPAAQKKKSHLGAIIAICVVIVIVAGGVIAARMLINSVTERLEMDSQTQTEQVSGWVEESPQGGAAEEGATTGGSTTPTQSDGSGDSWTVLMYLCGSDLESSAGYATYDLMEIQEASIGSNVNMVIEAGGTSRWQNNVYEAGYINRSVCSNGSYDVVDQIRMTNMGSESTFTDFLKWGVQNYPADHYMLLFWDHGGGTVYGVCCDEMFNDDMLTVAEFRDGIKESGIHFDVVGFDTCLMGTYETASALAPYADYMIASEEIISGAGWEYTSWLSWLSSNTGCTGAELGREVCDTYMKACKWYGLDGTATLSCIDLSKMKSLDAAFAKAAEDLAVATTEKSKLQVVAQAANSAEYYGEDIGYNMIDLYGFIDGTGSVISSDRQEALLGAIDDAVVYNVHGRNRAGAHGLSVFYPLYASDTEFDAFREIAPNMSYTQMAAVIAGTYDNYQWPSTTPIEEEEAAPVTENEVDITYNQSITDDGYLRLEIESGLEDIMAVEFELALLMGTPDDFDLIYLGSDNNLYADWDSGIFTDNFNGKWMTIDGCYVCAEIMDSRDGYNLYAIPVKLNGTEMLLRASYDFNTKKYSILDACETMDYEVGAASKARPLQEGDKITFLFVEGGSDSEEAEFIELDTITWHDGIEMVDEDLGDGMFVYNFRIVDVFGSEQSTESVVVDYSNGSIELKSIEDWVYEQM